MRKQWVTGLFGAALVLVGQGAAGQMPSPAPIDFYRLFPGFMAETRNDEGFMSGFAAPNPWGQYTAYLMATNAKGQRTIRIEHYIPIGEGKIFQGSTMYLLEGRDRALLIDTAQPARATPGVNDLKTVVRYILGHNSDGSPKAHPLDFLVANTHSHGDHIGENKLMNDRTVYYPDLDWLAANAPSNYVPIREGGGPTSHGDGAAVSEIDLGGRTVTAIAIPPHTAGSTGYLDSENQMLFSGDAIGSGFVWVQWGPLSRYQVSVHHLVDVTRPYPKLAVFGAHFYQYALRNRAQPPIDGRPADRQYIIDQAELADGIMNGTIDGEPYYLNRETVWATLRSAQIVYSLNALYPAGTVPGVPYHAVRIPSTYPEKFQSVESQRKTLAIKADFHLIRGPKGEIVYVLKGSRRTVLIGSGSGASGLKTMVDRFAGSQPVDIILTDDDPNELGGLSELKSARVYAPSHALRGRRRTTLKDGMVIDLGLDGAGRPLRLQVQRFGKSEFTLLDVNDKLLFAGRALGVQGQDSGWAPPGGVKAYKAELGAWRTRTDGRYDIVYTAGNYQWYTSPAYVDQLGQALDEALAGAPVTDSVVAPGMQLVKSDGPPDVVASVGIAGR